MQNLKNNWLVWLMFVLYFVLAFAPSPQGIQRFKTIYTDYIINAKTITTSDANVTDDLAVTDDASVGGDLAVTGDVTLSGEFDISNRANFWRYQDVAAAPSVRAAAGVVSATTSITTSWLGIAVPRNLVVTWQTVTTATAGNITVAGVDARGVSTSELIAVGAVSGTQTLTGAMPWASVTSFTLPTRTEAVTLTVAGGQKFGMPLIPDAAADVYHLTVNLTPQAAPTVNTTYGTFDPVSTPAANVDYDVWVK